MLNKVKYKKGKTNLIQASKKTERREKKAENMIQIGNLHKDEVKRRYQQSRQM